MRFSFSSIVLVEASNSSNTKGFVKPTTDGHGWTRILTAKTQREEFICRKERREHRDGVSLCSRRSGGEEIQWDF
jgi:hypothetical protein